MREIKFRAWAKIPKKMAKVSMMGLGLYLLEAEDGHTGSVDFENLEIMQYTGLKDKNGKEAYQDDIFRPWEDERTYQIVWDDDYAAFKCKQIGGKSWPCDMLIVGYGEVIGNIYENPELLNDS